MESDNERKGSFPFSRDQRRIGHRIKSNKRETPIWPSKADACAASFVMQSPAPSPRRITAIVRYVGGSTGRRFRPTPPSSRAISDGFRERMPSKSTRPKPVPDGVFAESAALRWRVPNEGESPPSRWARSMGIRISSPACIFSSAPKPRGMKSPTICRNSKKDRRLHPKPDEFLLERDGIGRAGVYGKNRKASVLNRDTAFEGR